MPAVTLRRQLSAATALCVATLAVLVPAAPAQAHTALSRTTPAARSTVTKPVTEVALTFTGFVKRSGTAVTVTGPDKISYSDAEPRIRDKSILQQVRPLPVGVITVAWRTTAADGHPLQGTFTFTNRAATTAATTSAATTAASVTAAPSRTPAPVVAGSESGSSQAGWLAAAAGGLLAIALLGGLLWWRRRPAS